MGQIGEQLCRLVVRFVWRNVVVLVELDDKVKSKRFSHLERSAFRFQRLSLGWRSPPWSKAELTLVGMAGSPAVLVGEIFSLIPSSRAQSEDRLVSWG